MRHAVWRLVRISVLAGVGYAIWRGVEANRKLDDLAWEPQPFPFPPQPRAVATPAERDPWVDAVDGRCPSSHPVKGKLTSGIYHEPGGASYERTIPDRCYCNPGAAQADGLRAPKR